MAGPSINTKVKLDGEREYKTALSQIGTALKQLQSELDLSAERFRDNAESEQALREQGDILNRQILTQQEKIATLREVLQKAGETYGEADTHTMKWATDLNKAEAELLKMERSLEENRAAYQRADMAAAGYGQSVENVADATDNLEKPLSATNAVLDSSKASAQGLGNALTDVAGQFGIQLPDGAAKAAEALNGINAGAALAVTGVGLLAAAVVKAEKALISATRETAEYAKEIKTLASITGQSTDSLQEFDYAAEMIGVSSDRIRDSLKETTNKMQEARDGNEATALAYQKLGVSIKDNVTGELRSAQDVFYDTIDALGKVQNQTERDALAMDLMSESAQELNPLIDIGSEGLKKYAQEAHDMGYVLDNDALASLAAVDDAQQKLLKSQEAVTKQISAEFAPYMAEALGDTADFILKIGKAFAESGIVEDFGSILASATAILEPIGELVKVFLPDLEEALRPVAEAVALIADTVNLLVGLLTLNGDRIKTALGLNLGSGQMSNQQKLYYRNAMTSQTYVAGQGYTGGGGYIEAGTGRWVPYNASGTDYFYGGRTLVGENGPEEVVLPRGSRITSASETRYSGAPVVHVGQIVIDAKNVREFNDVVRIMMNERISTRMEAK